MDAAPVARATHRGLCPELAMVFCDVAPLCGSAWQIALNQIRKLLEMFSGCVRVAQNRFKPVVAVVLRAREQKACAQKPAPCVFTPLLGLLRIAPSRAEGQQMQVATQQLQSIGTQMLRQKTATLQGPLQHSGDALFAELTQPEPEL